MQEVGVAARTPFADHAFSRIESLSLLRGYSLAYLDKIIECSEGITSALRQIVMPVSRRMKQ